MYKKIIATTSLLLAAQQAAALEEFYTAPGARAMAMGGAFTAVAADSSTIWYNPAGLGFLPSNAMDITADYGSVIVGEEDPVLNADGKYELYKTDNELKYLGFSGKGFGIAYFRPYDFNTLATTDSGQNVRVRTEYQELKFGFGFDMNEYVAIGGTIDMVMQDTDSNCNSCDESDGESAMGFTLGALGKWTLDEASHTVFQAGATFRSDTDVDVVLGDLEDLPNRPEVLSLGVALKRPFTLGGWSLHATGTVQRDDISYAKVRYLGQSTPIAVDHERTAYGVEMQFITPANHNFFVRLGGYESEADGGDSAFKPYSEGVEANTAGLGVMFESWVIDYAIENRTILKSDFSNVDDQDETLYSFSISRVL
ncbi:hypothetical protein Y5S_00698 [Alcanivorax nanhaiticus]|uniref:Uncharacterized protein n=1 Tax=Alcanivorax nanhaiticus TaxID=1177154 RepID=A0A095SNI5_9GAMM|nr:hypothetical protein [Alcanivorax nanhaiticus]KGD66226.1 hypothetical protein Y5S_00698 [Alcanivorax nanhaiticus]